MSHPYIPIDHHPCPDCGGEATNATHPCTTWFTCDCGLFFDSRELLEQQNQEFQAWVAAIDQDPDWIARW